MLGCVAGAVGEQTPDGFGWSNMFLSPDDDPRADGGFCGERETLVGFLRDQRLTFELKCDGLDAEQLSRRSVPPSTMSLLGLVRHLAAVEQSWFRLRMAGEKQPRHFRSGPDRDEDFNGAVRDDEVVNSAWLLWRAEVAFSQAYVLEAGSLDQVGKAGDTLRGVLVHMIEEYARHNGHADLLRECIDGRRGQ